MSDSHDMKWDTDKVKLNGGAILIGRSAVRARRSPVAEPPAESAFAQINLLLPA